MAPHLRRIRQLIAILLGLVLLLTITTSASSAAAASLGDVGTITTQSNDQSVRPAGNYTIQQRAPPRQQIPRGIQTIYNSTKISQTDGGATVTVAVLDSGVNISHPDLQDRVAECRDYTQTPTATGECTDTNGHGTHVAGTILADAGPNDTGIYGIAPKADLLAFKVCSDDGRCRSDTVASGVRDAVDAGADIIVLSLGGRNPGGTALDRAIGHANRQGALIVAAAGNDGPELDSIEYPAADPRVIAVGATTLGGQSDINPANYAVTEFSARGVNASEFKPQERYLEVSAPGQSVLSTWHTGGYATQSGTSVAVPHIAGFAALLWPQQTAASQDSSKAATIRRILRDRATWLDIQRGSHARPGYDPAAGIGIPVRKPIQVDISTQPRQPLLDDTVTFSATNVTAPDSEINRFVWDFNGDGHADAEGDTVTHTFTSAGTFTVELQAVDTVGARTNMESTVRVNAPPRAQFAIIPQTPLASEQVRFDAIGVDPDGRSVTYAWDFDGDGAVDATDPVTTHTFPTHGQQRVVLRVTDTEDATTTVERTILVNDQPSVTIDAPASVIAGEQVQFTANVANDVGATTIIWEFPDGTLTTGRTVRHQFDPGDYLVRVRVEDEYGASATTTHQLASHPPSPTPTPIDQTPIQTPTAAAPGTQAPPIPGFTFIAAVLAITVVCISRMALHSVGSSEDSNSSSS